jgi:hypothetical protein
MSHNSQNTDLEVIKRAIAERRTVEFNYQAPGKTHGLRRGQPHAVYIHETSGNILLDFYQTAGVSETGEPMPGWRRFYTTGVSSAEFLESTFNPAPGYKPNSRQYAKVICKV